MSPIFGNAIWFQAFAPPAGAVAAGWAGFAPAGLLVAGVGAACAPTSSVPKTMAMTNERNFINFSLARSAIQEASVFPAAQSRPPYGSFSGNRFWPRAGY